MKGAAFHETIVPSRNRETIYPVGSKDPFNLPESEFDVVMTEIDEDLRQKGDRIPGREVLAFAEYCARFKVTLAHNHPTAIRIFKWVERMYGDRLKVDWDFGQSVVLVKGELCKIRGIRFFGSLPLVCSTAVMGLKLAQDTPNGRIEVHNLLEGSRVQGLTPEMACRLSHDECAAILKAYGRMFLTFSRMEAAQGKRHGTSDAPFIRESMHDLTGSVESLLTAPPNYGQSKWASLQAAEKVIKSCIREKGSIPKNIHDLSRLCSTAVAVGIPAVDPALIASIQCSPNVRYDSTLVGKMDAVEAHYAALTMCGDLAPVMKRTTAESGVFDYEFSLSGGNKLKGILLGYAAPRPPFSGPTALDSTP